MQRGLCGTYEITRISGEEVRAFIPRDLPPAPPLELTHDRQCLLERATLALGKLDSIALLLPDPNIFLYAYVRREALLSSQIEGTQSSLSDLLLFEIDEPAGVPLDDVAEVSSYVSAMDHGMKRLAEGFPLSNRLLREMHAKLLARGRGSDTCTGEFRKTQNWIGGTRPGNAHFVPPSPQHLQACMSALEQFLHDKRQPYPVVVKAALAHVQFETIHPFLDGNGRMGRLLIAFILHHDGILTRPLLYLSLYFKLNRSRYYALLDRVRLKGDWESWLDFFLTGVETTANNAVQTAQRLITLFKQDEATIKSMGRISGSALRVFTLFCQQPILTLNRAASTTGLSFPTVSKSMNVLVKSGILRELTGKHRNRVFAYARYIDVLNEGTEPL